MADSNLGYFGNSIKLIIDSFVEGSSGHLLSVQVKFLLKFEGNVVQHGN